MADTTPILACVLLLCGGAVQAAPPDGAASSDGTLPPGERVAVPAGSFVQGAEGVPDAPPRTVTLSAFGVDRSEVSVADYAAFVAAGAYQQPALWSEEGRSWLAAHPEGAGAEVRASGRDGRHPVVAVTWFEADAYCRWAGGALPTEAQWERAACGDGGRRHPWGDEEAVEATWFGAGKFGHVDAVATRPVDEDPAPAGPFGLHHAAGNAWEWTADRYHRDAWATGQPATDPTGPDAGPWRVLRGGSFMNLPSYATCTHREPARPDRVALTTGFRCAYPQP